jgi:hypothetical protein
MEALDVKYTRAFLTIDTVGISPFALQRSQKLHFLGVL